MCKDIKLNIYHLFFDLLNFNGDTGNISVLKKRCEWRGIAVNVYNFTASDDVLDLSDADIVFIGAGSDKEQILVSAFADRVGVPLKEYIEENGVVLAVGAGYQLLGSYFEADGEKVKGFGVLDIYTVSSNERLIGNIAVESELEDKKMVLVGFENHAGKTIIGDYKPLGRVLAGYGNQGGGIGSDEGVIYKNTVATYLHGPILPKNPEVADYLISKALLRKYNDSIKLLDLDDNIENTAREFIIGRELKNNDRGN